MALYIKDGIAYNENLADFVGEYGAKRYLTSKYGADHPEYQNYLSRKSDRKKLTGHILKGAKQLDSLYKSFPEGIIVGDKAQKKEAFIASFMSALDTVSFTNQRYGGYFSKYTPDNTFFMSFVPYQAKQNEFKKEFEEKFESDFAAYLAYLKETNKSILRVF